MAPRRLAVIVEGDGDSVAVPLLVRKWLSVVGAWGTWTTPERAINARGVGRLKCPHDPGTGRGLEHFIAVAAKLPADAILVVLDADEECDQRRARRGEALGPELLRRANAASPLPAAVVVAVPAFEGWLVAHHLQAAVDDLTPTRCKKALSAHLGRAYGETTDQIAMARALPVPDRDRVDACSPRSYAKLFRSLAALMPP